jgi:protein transport protein SEC24
MSGQCVTILYTYRKYCATASSSGQLILPEALKLLPLYTMGMFELSPVKYLVMLL